MTHYSECILFIKRYVTVLKKKILTVLECSSIFVIVLHTHCSIFIFLLLHVLYLESSVLNWTVEKFSQKNRIDRDCYMIIILPALFVSQCRNSYCPNLLLQLKIKTNVPVLWKLWKHTLIQWACHQLRKPFLVLFQKHGEPKQLFQTFIKDHELSFQEEQNNKH